MDTFFQKWKSGLPIIIKYTLFNKWVRAKDGSGTPQRGTSEE